MVKASTLVLIKKAI